VTTTVDGHLLSIEAFFAADDATAQHLRAL
jgi:hypothetical protein